MEKMIAELKHPKLKSIPTDGRSDLDSLAKQEKPYPTPASSVEASNRSSMQVGPFKHGYSRDSGISVYTMTKLLIMYPLVAVSHMVVIHTFTYPKSSTSTSYLI